MPDIRITAGRQVLLDGVQAGSVADVKANYPDLAVAVDAAWAEKAAEDAASADENTD